MKTAKLILSTIALIGIAGSIFAFKTKKRAGLPPYYLTTQAGAAACATWTRAITVSPGGIGFLYYFTIAKCNIANRLGVVNKGD